MLCEKIFSKCNIDGLFITNLINIRYLTGFTGSSAFLLLTPKKNIFLTDFRYKTQSQNEIKGKFTFIFYQKKLLSEIINLLKKYKIKKLGIEEEDSRYGFVRDIIKKTNISIVDCSRELLFLRKIKSTNEIKQIKKALQCAENSFEQVRPFIKPGIKEKDIAIELEYKIKKNGADDIAFPIIVASGKRSALPHAKPSLKKIKNNEFVIIDFGAKINGYNSDITYTLNFGNKNKLLNKAYKVVQDSIDLAKKLIGPDKKADLIDKEIHDFIKQNGFKDGLIHSLGHGVGMDIHELPVLSRNKEDVFQKDMVFTIEPGIYLENIGGVRLEIMALITDNGVKILNSIK